MSTPSTIYLVRHAVAAERGPDWPEDAERPLTSSGTARMRRVVRGLRELDVRIDVVATSPLVRAVETAEVLLAGLKPVPALQVVPALSPGGVITKAATALAAIDAPDGLAVVGHEPGLGHLAAWFLGLRGPLPFKKGGVCRIDFDERPAAGGGRLVWFATPKMLRKVGG